jgi:hypothetical protein
MTRFGVMVDRVKAWFGGGGRRRRHPALPRRWTFGPDPADLALAAVGSGRAAQAAPRPDADALAAPDAAPPEETSAAWPPLSEPVPEWVERLEELPDRVAEAVGRGAAGTKTLERIAAELDGHRARSGAATEAIGRLPDLGQEHTALLKEANRLLDHQNRLGEALLDGFKGLRAALRTVEESSRRHLACIHHLETTHRQVLEVYQGLLLRAHRRLGRLSAAAVLLALAALAGVAYAIWRTAGISF